MVYRKPRSLWRTLGGSEGSILDVYGGEYEFDRYTVNLLNRRGADRGVQIRYGKNLRTLEMDRNCANVYTGVYPYWYSDEKGLVQLPEKILHAEGTYSFERIRDLDLTDEFEDKPTEDQLRQKATSWMNAHEIGIPIISWTINFQNLDKTAEYQDIKTLEHVALGDTVRVIFPDMGVDASARVVATDYDPIKERYNSVTIGRVRANLASTVVDQQKEIEKKPSKSQVEKAIELSASLILGAEGGSVRILDTDGDGVLDTLYFGDNEDPALAQKVWRFNYEGWASSKDGYNGPFTMAATIENGMSADFITAGTLNAALVNVINLVADHVRSNAGESSLEITGARLNISNGANTTVKISNEAVGYPIMYLHDYRDGVKTSSSELSPHHIKIGGTSADPILQIGIQNGKPDLQLGNTKKTISWHDNEDGTWSIIGT